MRWSKYCALNASQCTMYTINHNIWIKLMTLRYFPCGIFNANDSFDCVNFVRAALSVCLPKTTKALYLTTTFGFFFHWKIISEVGSQFRFNSKLVWELEPIYFISTKMFAKSANGFNRLSCLHDKTSKSLFLAQFFFPLFASKLEMLQSMEIHYIDLYFSFPNTHTHADVVCAQRSAFLSPQHASSIQHYHHLINAIQNLRYNTHILFVHLVQYLNIGFCAVRWFFFLPRFLFVTGKREK